MVKNQIQTKPENELNVSNKPDPQRLYTLFDPPYVIKKAEEELAKDDLNNVGYKPDSFVFRALTLQEFDNGALMSAGFKDQYKSLLIDLSKQIQKEYGCTTKSQKALVEIMTSAYGRTLQIQYMMNDYFNKGTITEIGIKYLDFLSKELDRANRHYVTSLQALIALKQPLMNITVNTQSANIANSQLIQENHNVKPI